MFRASARRSLFAVILVFLAFSFFLFFNFKFVFFVHQPFHNQGTRVGTHSTCNVKTKLRLLQKKVAKPYPRHAFLLAVVEILLFIKAFLFIIGILDVVVPLRIVKNNPIVLVPH